MEEKQFQPAAFATSSQILYFVQSRHIVLEVRLLISVHSECVLWLHKKREETSLTLTWQSGFIFLLLNVFIQGVVSHNQTYLHSAGTKQ